MYIFKGIVRIYTTDMLVHNTFLTGWIFSNWKLVIIITFQKFNHTDVLLLCTTAMNCWIKKTQKCMFLQVFWKPKVKKKKRRKKTYSSIRFNFFVKTGLKVAGCICKRERLVNDGKLGDKYKVWFYEKTDESDETSVSSVLPFISVLFQHGLSRAIMCLCNAEVIYHRPTGILLWGKCLPWQ